MKSRNLVLLCLLAVASCTSTETRIIPGDQLVPSDAPNIRSVTLFNGQIINFDADLGWYDRQRAYIEGVSSEGEPDTIPVASVKVALISETRANAVGSIFAAIGLMALALTIAAAIYVGQMVNRSGCIVLIAGLVSAATVLGAILIVIRP